MTKSELTQLPPARYDAEFRSGYRVRLTFSPSGMRCEWAPEIPKKPPAGLAEAYREFRDEALADYARQHRINLVVVDVL